ncbi:nuclear transport factor 2 family protein [Gordonia paraffinivorans]|uniref:nuclear transport factor 2 family protein n=1 Tax=Gordonia paraffinivorans TaxID=175628 RepID=UPI0014461BE6|nr:nuclear transport factor 2 family protein [Gordonia paraffinivorans]
MSRLEDRLAIHDCLYRYARSVDRLDYDGIADCYFDDAIDTHADYVGGVAGLVEDIRLRHAAIDSSQHFVTNILVEFAGEDMARVESYCLAYLRKAREAGRGTQTEYLSRCRYVDRFERRKGRWAIADRVVVFDETREIEVVDVQGPEWVASRRDATDPVYTWGRGRAGEGNPPH